MGLNRSYKDALKLHLYQQTVEYALVKEFGQLPLG